MSHFSVLVVSSERPTHEVLKAILQPWHEFECTGIDDQYVQDVDRTKEAIEHCAGRDNKEESIADALEGWYGWKAIGPDEVPSMTGEHQYGYVRLNAEGGIMQAIARTNPNKKWDWWVLGGRWKGMLRMSAAGEVRHVETTKEALDRRTLQGEPGLMGSAYSDSPSAIDICQRRDLDIAGMKAEAVAKRREAWRSTVEAAKNAGVFTDEAALDDLRRQHALASAAEVERFKVTPGVDRRAHYKEHMPAHLAELDDVFDYLIWPRTTKADKPISEWIDAAPALQTFAVVKDGQWVERGSMGWFGCVTDEKDEDAWGAAFAKMLDAIPGDHWLAVVDCHI